MRKSIWVVSGPGRLRVFIVLLFVLGLLALAGPLQAQKKPEVQELTGHVEAPLGRGGQHLLPVLGDEVPDNLLRRLALVEHVLYLEVHVGARAALNVAAV